jgi:hypothetical protein
MTRANWYCQECETHGGGPPCNMTMKEHIDLEHNGEIARMKEL